MPGFDALGERARPVSMARVVEAVQYWKGKQAAQKKIAFGQALQRATGGDFVNMSLLMGSPIRLELFRVRPAFDIVSPSMHKLSHVVLIGGILTFSIGEMF